MAVKVDQRIIEIAMLEYNRDLCSHCAEVLENEMIRYFNQEPFLYKST